MVGGGRGGFVVRSSPLLAFFAASFDPVICLGEVVGVGKREAGVRVSADDIMLWLMLLLLSPLLVLLLLPLLLRCC